MNLVLTKKNIVVVILASVLFLISLGFAIFFLLKQKNQGTTYSVDKYTQVLDWCEDNVVENNLQVNCKALLLDITNSGCYDVQILTKNNGLSNLSICEEGDSLIYTNEILSYKKLMPIDISFNYSKEGALNSYVFFNVSFEPMDEEYIHSIINESIASLVQTDVRSVTTIKNSVNFCPRPEQLPKYIAEENIRLYTDFYNANIAEDFLLNSGGLYDLGDNNIQIFLGRYSQMISGIETTSDAPEIIITDNILQELQSTPTFSQLSSEINKDDIFLLKTLTILYDNISEMQFSNNSDALYSILKALNSTESLSHTSLCSTILLLQELPGENPAISNYITTLEENFLARKDVVTDPLCYRVSNNNYFDKTGNNILIYFNLISENNNFKILNNCMNLYDFYK